MEIGVVRRIRVAEALASTTLRTRRTAEVLARACNEPEGGGKDRSVAKEHCYKGNLDGIII